MRRTAGQADQQKYKPRTKDGMPTTLNTSTIATVRLTTAAIRQIGVRKLYFLRNSVMQFLCSIFAFSPKDHHLSGIFSAEKTVSLSPSFVKPRSESENKEVRRGRRLFKLPSAYITPEKPFCYTFYENFYAAKLFERGTAVVIVHWECDRYRRCLSCNRRIGFQCNTKAAARPY